MSTQATETQHANWKRDFFTIWGGQAFSLLGSQLVQFALIWYLTERTGSATVLATVSMIALLPGVFLAPFIGVLVDRWNRRMIMIVADSLIALVTFGMLLLFATGVIEIWHIYVVVLLRSIGQTFHYPAMSSTTSLMVPTKQLARVQGLNQTLNGGLNIVAAPLGALLLETLPMHSIVAIDVVTAVIAVLPLLFIAIPQPKPMDGQKRSFFGDMRDGFKYVTGWTGLLIIIGMATLINFLLSPAFSLLPIVVKNHFGGGAMQLGTLNAVFGVGVIIGGVLLSTWGGFKRRMASVTIGIFGIGLGSLIMGILPPTGLIFAVAAMALLGFVLPITNGSLGAIFQTTIDPAIQGRVFTLINSGAQAMTPLGLAVAGPLSDAVGTQIWFVISGLICFGMAILMIIIPSVANIEQSPQVLARAQVSSDQ